MPKMILECTINGEPAEVLVQPYQTLLEALRENVGLTGQARTEALWALFFMAPWIAGFLVFVLGPMLASLYLSLTTFNITRPPAWVGARVAGGLAIVMGLLALVALSWFLRGTADATQLFELLQGVILGTLRMPALLRAVGLTAHRAVGTNLVVGFLLGVAGFAAHAARLEVEWAVLAAGLAGAIPGAILGARTTGRLSEETLRRALGIALLVIAATFVVEILVR